MHFENWAAWLGGIGDGETGRILPYPAVCVLAGHLSPTSATHILHECLLLSTEI